MVKHFNKILGEQLIAISNLLKEEYSIDDSVKYEATRIAYEIKKAITKEKNNEIVLCKDPYITFRHGKLNTNLFEKNVLIVHFQCYNFPDNITYEEYFDKVPYRVKNQYDRKNGFLDISVNAVKGYIDPNTLYDTVQHELEHAFQEDKIGMSFSDKPLYSAAKEFRKTSETEAKNNVGEILYLTYQAEQDAYVNGLYATLVNNYKTDKIRTAYVFEMSEVYGVLERMVELKDYLIKNKNNTDLINAIADLRKRSHIGYSRLISLIDEAIVRLRKKIARVIYKAQKDCNYYNDMEYANYSDDHYASIKKIISNEIDKIIRHESNRID